MGVPGMRLHNTVDSVSIKQRGRKAPNGHQSRIIARPSRSDLPLLQKEEFSSNYCEVGGQRGWPCRNQVRLLQATVGAGAAGATYGRTVSEVTITARLESGFIRTRNVGVKCGRHEITKTSKGDNFKASISQENLFSRGSRERIGRLQDERPAL